MAGSKKLLGKCNYFERIDLQYLTKYLRTAFCIEHL